MQLHGDEGAPFDDDLATIASHLDDLEVPALLMSVVHMIGDLSLLEGPLRPRESGIFTRQGGMTPAQQAEVRALALDVIAAYRASGYRVRLSPDVHEALTMMRGLVATDVGDEYAELVHGELHVGGVDPGEVLMRSAPEDRGELPVVVVGCGESGLLAGIRLREAGIPFTIVEKNSGVGGTWHENRYPGCRVDIPNHFYSYGFETNDHWTEFFSGQPEIEAYLQGVMDRHEIDPHVRWRTEVTRMVWDETGAVWRVEVRSADGTIHEIVARAVIAAVGQLNRPVVPAFDGADGFAGPSFHTARWDEEVDLDGKRVAVVGAGATGFQLVPAIAERAEQVTVYQRTAQWSAPNPAYFARVRAGVGWALRHLPYYARWYRLLLMWNVTDGARDVGLIDPAWDGEGRYPAVRSYYKHADGHVYTVMPWRAIDYWQWTRRADPADFVLR